MDALECHTMTCHRGWIRTGQQLTYHDFGSISKRHIMELCPSDSVPVIMSDRLRRIEAQFTDTFGCSPTYICRAPGRVNLIGEHIDYCGYSVLPMALLQDVVIAAAPRTDPMVQLANTNSQYSRHEAVDISCLKVDGRQWYHYVLCGIKGVVEQGLADEALPGLMVLVDGVVPPSAGLSSSSALVCCAALAASHLLGFPTEKSQLAELCARSERYIGTEGGGMDQAISFLAESGRAKLIDFNPLCSTDVTLPRGSCFVIANSMVEMSKSLTAGTHFNVRVAECRVSAMVLLALRGLDWNQVRRLKDAQIKLGLSLKQMCDEVERSLKKEAYTPQELARVLEVDVDELFRTCLSESVRGVTEFHLHKRALHVFSEAARVMEFKRLCESGDGDLDALGALMLASHRSCQQLYNCSCDELDELVQVCLDGGSLGSRLTGAGWGGCTVSLVPEHLVETFIGHVKHHYYNKRFPQLTCLDNVIFATSPGGGACAARLR